MKTEYKIHNLSDVINAYTAQKVINGKLQDIGGRRDMTTELEIMKAVLSSSLSDSQKAEMIVVGGHQHRLQCTKAAAAKTLLVKTMEKGKLWKNSYTGKTFEDLYDDIENLLKTNNCTYAGKITKYDFAKRIGVFVNCLPNSFVYLHSGALIGAQRLLGVFNLKEGKYPIGLFSKYFSSLNAMEIEDILCVFHNIYDCGGVTIRHFFDDSITLACHAFFPSPGTKNDVNNVLIKNNLPIIK